MKTLAARWHEISLGKFFVIQYGTKHHEIVSSSDVISIEPDLCLLWEGGSSGEVVFVNQLNKSLRRRGLLCIYNHLILMKTCYLKVTSAARLIMALVTTPVCPSAAPRASPGKMYLVQATNDGLWKAASEV